MSTVSSMSEFSMPVRPDQGSRGKRIQLITNFFEISKVPSADLHMYNVQIIPEVPRALKLRIVSALCEEHKDLFESSVTAAYDGEAALYYPRRTSWNVHTGVVKLADRQDQFTVKLEHVAVVNMTSLHQFISGADIDMPQDCIQALDVVCRTTPLASEVCIGSSFFTGRNTFPLGAGVEIWFGYHQSLRPAHGRLLINLDVAASCFHRTQPVLEVVKAITKKEPSRVNSAYRAALRAELVGVRIYVTHRGDQKRKYRIADVAKESAVELTFKIKDEPGAPTTSVADYFEKRYKCKLQYPNLPLLTVGSKAKPSYLPMEVCHTAGGDRITKKLAPAQTAAMIKKTAAKPQIRLETITKSFRDRNYGQDRVVNEFGLGVSPNPVQINGRVLDPPVIQYNPQQSRRSQIQPQLGSWLQKDVMFYTSPPVNSWGVLVFERRVRPEELSRFLSALNETGKGLGVTFRKPVTIPFQGRGQIHYQDALHRAVNEVAQTAKFPCQLLLIILPFDDPKAYGEIKRICDTVLDVPSQCMLSKNIQKADRTYCGNLLQKINTKIGGVNCVLSRSPSQDFMFKKPAIIFGADVSHAVPFSNLPSIAAVVASMDAHPCKYACEIRAQKARRELIEQLKEMSKNLLKRFYLTTKGKKPERILFYRDGVSEGQFDQVLRHEVTALRQACQELESGYTPKITFVVVQKRHHARFFVTPSSMSAADRSGNVPAGTVVDSSIVHPRQFDFYLVAHAGIQGTSRPTHYHVLFDENQFTSDLLQDLTYRQCYTYARCTRSVSLVPAAYYAHLAAFRARYHMKAEDFLSESASEAALTSAGVPVVKEHTGSQMYFV